MSLFNFHTRTLRLVLAGATLTLAGGSLGTGCGSGDLASVEGFCAALATADCGYAIVQACLGSSDATIQADIDRCVAARSPVARCNPNGLTYHPDFAEVCIAQHQAVFATTTVDGATFRSIDEQCLAVFNQGKALGSECTGDTDCDAGYAGLRCMIRVGGKGSCQVPRPVLGGASCKALDAQCPAGNYCDDGFHCVELPTKNDACGAGKPCATGYRCDAGLEICQSQLPNGEVCTAASDCAGSFCLAGADGKSRCSASLVFAQGSAICLDFTQP